MSDIIVQKLLTDKVANEIADKVANEIADKVANEIADKVANGLFDDVWDLNENTTGIVTSNKSDICEWDDILNVYEPTRILEKPVKSVNETKPTTVVSVKSQSKPSAKKNVKPIISITSNKKIVAKHKYDSEEDDNEYDDTYDDYY